LTAVGGRRATVPSEANPDPVPDLGIPGTDMTSQELWKAILDQLQFQMTRATFDTWLRDTHVARVGNDHLVIATPNPRAVEWLKLRLNPVICRTLAGLLGHAVTVEYEVADERG
jgi:chromosomal replication initiator protein